MPPGGPSEMPRLACPNSEPKMMKSKERAENRLADTSLQVVISLIGGDTVTTGNHVFSLSVLVQRGQLNGSHRLDQ